MILGAIWQTQLGVQNRAKMILERFDTPQLGAKMIWQTQLARIELRVLYLQICVYGHSTRCSRCRRPNLRFPLFLLKNRRTVIRRIHGIAISPNWGNTPPPPPLVMILLGNKGGGFSNFPGFLAQIWTFF